MVLKRKSFYAYIYRKYLWTCPSTKTESTKFFLFAVVFLQPSCSFPLCFFSSPSFSLFFLFLYYILWPFYHFLLPHVDQVVEVLYILLLLPFLESSILSCKAACLLFRHHLHINAARGLAGQHLMRRQQYPQIFVFLSLLSFI